MQRAGQSNKSKAGQKQPHVAATHGLVEGLHSSLLILDRDLHCVVKKLSCPGPMSLRCNASYDNLIITHATSLASMHGNEG